MRNISFWTETSQISSSVRYRFARKPMALVSRTEVTKIFRIVGDGWRDDLVRLENSTFTTGSYGVLNIIDINSRIGTVEKTKGIILVPGLAFTEFGTRLGRGAGYYDQLLNLTDKSEVADFISIGICREVQLLEDLPQQPHDRSVRMVITF